jgi:hypothetical protein
MRTGLVFVLTAFFSGTSGTSAQTTAQAALDATRSTLGGAAALDDVKTFRAEGRAVRVLGPLTLGSRITLTLVRPDKYLRKDSISLPGTAAQTGSGFNGDRVIQWAASEDGRRLDSLDVRPTGATGQTLGSAAPELRHELRLLLLGWFADAFDEFKPTVVYQGVAEASDGTADAIRLTFPDGSSATLFTDRTTRLPLMVSWQAVDTLAPLRALSGRGPLAGATQAGQPGEPLPIVEHRLYFSDYRQVGKVRWPFVIRRAVGGQPVEEMRFERIAVNPTVDPELFNVGR